MCLYAQTTLIQFKAKQVYCDSDCCIHTCATCFGVYLGPPQAYKYKNFTRKIMIMIMIISGAPLCTVVVFYNLKTRNVKYKVLRPK